ncbi:MAG: serine/threonine-protein kinase [Streptosporangiaceae bacterium]
MNGTEPPITALEPTDPRTLGSYQVLGRLGAGGMGVVYLGVRDGARVAIKVIRRDFAVDPAFRARFATEVANACRVASFCTAQVLEHGESQGLPYLVTEYVQGMPLKDYVEIYGPFPAASLRALAIGIGTALLAIHAARLVHRDLKPHNVLLAKDGPRVIDFGIARAMDATSQHTATGVVVGSPGWIAPEQFFDGVVSPAGDVFCWGSLVAFAATGRHPFGTGNMMVLAVRAQQGTYDLTGVPADLRGLVERTLNPDPARRPTGEQLVLELIGQGGEAEAHSQISSVWTPNLLPSQVFAPLQVPAPHQSTQPPYGRQTSDGGTQPPYPSYGQATYGRQEPAATRSRLPLIAASVALVLAAGGGVAGYALLQDKDDSKPDSPSSAGPISLSGVSPEVAAEVEVARGTVEKYYSYAGWDTASLVEQDLPVTAQFLQTWKNGWTQDRRNQAKTERESQTVKIGAAAVISTAPSRIDALLVGDRSVKSTSLDNAESLTSRVTLQLVNGRWALAQISQLKEGQQPAINPGASWPAGTVKTAASAAGDCLMTYLTVDYGSLAGHKIAAGACLTDAALATSLPEYESRLVLADQKNTVSIVDVAAETYPLADRSRLTFLVSTVLSQDLADGGQVLVAPYVWRLTMKQDGATWKIADLESLQHLKSS